MFTKTLSTVAVLATASLAHADTFQFNAAIDILDALNITEQTQMDFGVIERPTTEATTAIDVKSQVVQDRTTARYIDTSTIASGRYLVSGSELAAVNLQAKDLQNVPGLRFQSLDASYDGATSQNILGQVMAGLAAPGAGKNLLMGGTLVVDPSVEEGTYAPAFNLDVSYE